MNYAYYNQAPAWGTQSYHPGKPPTPAYQPQPSWGGGDYYRAHTGSNDDSTFANAWGRTRNRGTRGPGKSEARYWHQKIYGGGVDVRSTLPIDIGTAAAYEAWRSWKYHYGIYGQPIGNDHERQREALVGIAVGEAARLWGYTGRSNDSYGRNEATQSAAATADRIFTETWNVSGRDTSGGGLLSGGSPHRPRTRSFNGGLSPYANGAGGGFATPRPVSPSMSGLMPGAGGLGMGNGGMGNGSSYGPSYAASDVSSQSYGSYPGNGYASSSPYAPQAGLQQTYPGGSQGNGYASPSPYAPQAGLQQNYSGGSPYGYAGSTGSMPSAYAPTANELVIHVPHRSRSHSHSGKHHHRRLRSHSPNPRSQYDDSYGRGHQGHYY